MSGKWSRAESGAGEYPAAKTKTFPGKRIPGRRCAASDSRSRYGTGRSAQHTRCRSGRCAADFIKFQVAQDGKVKLDLDKSTADALSGKKIKLSCLDKDGNAVAVALDKSNPSTLLSKKDVTAGEYYLGVTCANVKKYDASYSIKTGLLAAG